VGRGASAPLFEVIMIYLRATALTLFCVFIFILGMATENTARMDVRNPYTQVLVKDKSGKEYWADVIADLESFSKEKDRSRLLRIIDNDARVAIYITQNDMAEMFTSMQVVPSTALDVNSNLYKRMDW
jgi:hypothetical protein